MGLHGGAAAALIALATLTAQGAPDRDAAAIEDADRTAIGPLEEFERRPEVERARRALAAARDARDRLESTRVSDRFAAARREELAFLNHLVPAFDAYLAGSRGAEERRTLEGIVARGRRHREQSREALRREARRTPARDGL